LTSSGLRSIARNTGQMTGARIVAPLMQAVYVIVIAAYLGPELFGLLSYSRSWYLALLPLAVLGLGPILSREIGAERGRAAEVAGRATSLCLVQTLLAALACAIVGYFVETDPAVRTLIAVYSLALVVRALGILAEQVFVAFESAGYVLRQEALFRPLEAGIGSAVVVLGGGMLGVAVVHVVIWSLQACRGLFLVRTRLVSLRLDWSWGPLAAMFRQGSMIGIAGFCTVWLLNGPLILYRHVGASEFALGQLGLAIQLLGLAAALPFSIGAAAMPVLSRAIARGDRKDSLFIGGICRLVIVLGTAVAISAMDSGPWFAKTIFGADFAAAGHLFGPALFLLVPLTIGHSAQTLLFARNRLRTTVLCAGAGALVLIVGVFQLATWLDALGAVLAAGLGMGVWAVASLTAVARIQDLDISRVIVRPLGAAVCAVVAYWVLTPLDPWLAWLGSMVALLGAGALLGIVSLNERSAMAEALRHGRNHPARDPVELPSADNSS